MGSAKNKTKYYIFTTMKECLSTTFIKRVLIHKIMNNNLTIGIPAYNEQNTIESTILSVINQENISSPLIYVCTNGCTDNTEKIVKDLSKNFDNLKLIQSERGKPNAWNKIKDLNTSRYLMFIDADVIVSPEAVSLMYAKIKKQESIATGCNPIAILKGTNYFIRPNIIPKQRRTFRSISGPGYMLDIPKFDERMNLYGYEKMPIDIINEDRWVALVIGQDNISYKPEAKIYYKHVSTIKDYIKSSTRIISGSKQLEEEYPELNYKLSSKLKIAEKWIDRAKRFRDLSFGRKIIALVNYITKKPVNKVIRLYSSRKGKKLYQKGKHTNHWEVTESSKINLKGMISNQT